MLGRVREGPLSVRAAFESVTPSQPSGSVEAPRLPPRCDSSRGLESRGHIRWPSLSRCARWARNRGRRPEKAWERARSREKAREKV